jgi:hypothetical protein
MKGDEETGYGVWISNDVSKEILAVASFVIDAASVAGIWIGRALWLKCDAFLEAPGSKQEK